jgi:hyaluronan synthase
MIDFLTGGMWLTFVLYFTLFAKSLWFYYYFGIYAYKSQAYEEEYTGTTALIVPVYNEDEEKLRATIKASLEANGLNEIIYVNDGSTNPSVQRVFDEFKTSRATFITLEKNVGKRKAQTAGFEAVSKPVTIYVCMDSDTILKKNSVTELLKPFVDATVGGTTACILVKNKRANILTRAVSAMYWSASKIWRQAPNNYGFIQTTNGQLSAYRSDVIKKIIPSYTTQTFMGYECTFSDDRYITHHIQTDHNKRIVYVDSSEVYTYIPETVKGCWKMFLRWKRGAWRESVLVIKNFKKKPALITDIWANHFVQLAQVLVRISIIIISFYDPIMILYYLIIVLIISTLFSYHMVWNNIKELPYKLLYSLLNEFIFSWAYVWALITIKQQGWATR